MLDFETKLLDEILDPVTRSLSPRAAAKLAKLRASRAMQKRVDELADKCGEGTLTEEERAEYAAYVSVANLLAILQAKVRRIAAGGTAA